MLVRFISAKINEVPRKIILKFEIFLNIFKTIYNYVLKYSLLQKHKNDQFNQKHTEIYAVHSFVLMYMSIIIYHHYNILSDDLSESAVYTLPQFS